MSFSETSKERTNVFNIVRKTKNLKNFLDVIFAPPRQATRPSPLLDSEMYD
jgi:hypothetical protein